MSSDGTKDGFLTKARCDIAGGCRNREGRIGGRIRGFQGRGRNSVLDKGIRQYPEILLSTWFESNCIENWRIDRSNHRKATLDYPKKYSCDGRHCRSGVIWKNDASERFAEIIQNCGNNKKKLSSLRAF